MAVNPDITNYGGITYTNNENNWRAEDIEFLQRRAVLRYPRISGVNGLQSSDHDEVGAIAYIAEDADNDDEIEPGADPHFRGKVNSTDGWRRFVTSEYLRIPPSTDLSGSVRLRHSGASSGVSLKSDGAVAVDNKLEVGTQVSVQGGVVSLTGGGTTRTLQVSSGKLVCDGTLRGNVIESAGAISGASLSTTGAVTVGNGLTVSAGGLTVSGGTASLGTMTAGNATFTGFVSSAQAFTAGVVRLNASGVGVANDPTVLVGIDSNSIDLLAPAITMRHNSSQVAVNVAGVITSADPPPSGSYPDGTIWIEV